MTQTTDTLPRDAACRCHPITGRQVALMGLLADPRLGLKLLSPCCRQLRIVATRPTAIMTPHSHPRLGTDTSNLRREERLQGLSVACVKRDKL